MPPKIMPLNATRGLSLHDRRRLTCSRSVNEEFANSCFKERTRSNAIVPLRSFSQAAPRTATESGPSEAACRILSPDSAPASTINIPCCCTRSTKSCKSSAANDRINAGRLIPGVDEQGRAAEVDAGDQHFPRSRAASAHASRHTLRRPAGVRTTANRSTSRNPSSAQRACQPVSSRQPAKPVLYSERPIGMGTALVCVPIC